jgi:hypothetical protein
MPSACRARASARHSRLFGELEAVYTGTSPPSDTDAWKALPGEFCIACYHLAEWIAHDPAVPPAVQTRARSYPATTVHVALAEAVANTQKHHTRNRGTEARVGGMDFRPGPPARATFRIDWRDPSGKTGGEDALVLARGAVTEWRGFFAAHGLRESC